MKKITKTVLELEQELQKYKINNQRWQKMYDHWNQEKVQLMNEKLTSEQALEFAHKENTALHTKQDAYSQQLQEKQTRIDELNRLHTQTQANLEHYREATREQRQLDQRQHEQHQQQLQSEIKLLNDQLAMQREKAFETQQQLKIMQQSYTVLEEDHTKLQSKFSQLNNKLHETATVKNEFNQKAQHWEKWCQELQQIQKKQANQLIDIQVENKQLFQRVKNADRTLSEMKDQNKLLSYDKWMLVQEKAQLEGQLKQAQKMIIV